MLILFHIMKLKILGLNDITENENIVFYEIKENNSEFPLVIEFLYLKDLLFISFEAKASSMT